MARVIRELAAKLSFQAESFNNSIKEAQRNLKDFEKEFKPSLSLAKELGVGMGAAGSAIVGSMLLATRSAVNYGDALNDARQRTGIAVETLAQFGFAAEQSGASVGDLAIGMKGLANNLQAVGQGGKAQVEAFAQLGMSAAQLASANGDLNQIMLLVADRFAAMEDGAQKSALAVDIFGKAGVNLIPMLNEGSKGLKELGDQAKAAGLVIDQDTAEASDKLNDSLNALKASVLGASLAIADPLVPILQKAADLTVKGTQALGSFIKEHEGLTVATLAAGAALTVAGGALVGIAVVVPKLVLGFGLLKVGTLATVAAMEGLATAIVGFKVLGVALSAQVIGMTAGLVALTAALSIGIGKLINYGLEVTGLHKVVDAFTKQAMGSFRFGMDAITDAQESTAFTAAAVAKGWKASAVEGVKLTAATEELTTKTRTYEDFVQEGIAAQKAEAEALKEATEKKREAAEASERLAASERRMGAAIRQTTAELVAERAALYGKAVAQAAVTTGRTGILNPSPLDPNYNPNDPFGLIAKNNALISTTSGSLTNIAPQPAIPANLNIGGNTPAFSGGGGGGGAPAGFVNGVYTAGTPQPQGTSTFGDVRVTINTTKPVDSSLIRNEVIPLLLESLENGHGREKLTGIVKTSWSGVTSTKV